MHICNCCNYTTSRKSNMKIHLKSEKHKRNADEFNGTIITKKKYNTKKKEYICKNCDKICSSSQSLYYHKNKVCTENKSNKIKQLEEENKLLKKQLLNNKKINITNNNIVNNIIEHQTNIENQTTIENHTVNILCYNNTDVSHITHDTYKQILSDNTYDTMTKLLELIHLNTEKPENMNLLITSLKEKYMQIFQDNKWKVVCRKEQIEELFDSQWTLLINWFTANRQHLSDFIKKRYKWMETHLENQNEKIYDEMIRVLYNERDIVIKNKKKYQQCVNNKKT